MEMTLNQFADCVVSAGVQRVETGAHLPMLAWSAPGVGKSSVVQQAAEALTAHTGHQWALVDMRVSQLDPVDLRGIPNVDSGLTEFAPPGWLPRVERHGEHGILFLDEINLGAASTRHACYQLVLDRKLGDYTLPDGWIVVAASNRSEDKTGIGTLDAALMNRFAVHAEITLSYEDWAEWAADAGVRPEVIAFLGFRRDLLHEYAQGGVPKGTRAYATPRTWVSVSEIIGLSFSDPGTEHAAIQGCVGEGPGNEFLGFLRIFRSLPDVRSVLRDPDGVEVPTDPATQYALAACLTHHVDGSTFDSAVRFCERMAPEFAVLMVRDATARNPDLKAAPGYADFKVRNQFTV